MHILLQRLCSLRPNIVTGSAEHLAYKLPTCQTIRTRWELTKTWHMLGADIWLIHAHFRCWSVASGRPTHKTWSWWMVVIASFGRSGHKLNIHPAECIKQLSDFIWFRWSETCIESSYWPEEFPYIFWTWQIYFRMLNAVLRRLLNHSCSQRVILRLPSYLAGLATDALPNSVQPKSRIGWLTET